MNYESKSIRSMIEMIGRQEVYLPAIQRRFVWKHPQIENLFDSIMRGYPIGTFLLWFVRGSKKDEYTFYKLLPKYHERDKYLNEIAPKPELKDEIIGVLDGQQRLSAMYISLQGTYAYKKPYARWDNDYAFPERKFYLNLLKDPVDTDEDDFLYEFRFLADGEAGQIDGKQLWFPVSDVLTWGEDPDVDEYYDGLMERGDLSDNFRSVIKGKRGQIKKTLRILHQRLVIEDLISYYRIEEQELDEILDIFVRVNSAGTVLSKSDLFFSTIVAHWEEGREQIEAFLHHINNKGDGFWFDNDFIMRSCLVLTDCPVLFKVRSFKKENIERIKTEWEDIKSAIDKSVDLLVEFGFSSENLTSQNAVIPIAYFFIRGGNDTQDSRDGLRKYLIHSLLKQIYGSQGDRVLSGIRDALREEDGDGYVLKCRRFDFTQLLKANLPGSRSLKILNEDIEEIMEYRKGPYTFMVLSLLYPNLRFSQVKFHQDHIHPASLFSDAKLKDNNIPSESWKRWQEIKDRLPNLQLMEGQQNESKNKTPFKDWLYGRDRDGKPNVGDVEKIKADNYIPEADLSFENFARFYELREDKIKKEIVRVFGIEAS